MDNFMSKLSQKISATDTIKANFMADMNEKEQMKKQIEEYGAALQDMRNLFLKQEQNSEMIVELVKKLENMQMTGAVQPEVIEEIKACISKSDEFTHKECVKVYRNVQALLEEQNQQLDKCVASLKNVIEENKTPDVTDRVDTFESTVKKEMKSIKIMLWIIAILSIVNIGVMIATQLGVLTF